LLQRKDNSFVHTILGQQLHLLPEKCIYWNNQNCLLISDIHIGKVDHFRKHGIAIPSEAAAENYRRLCKLLDSYEPLSVIFLGDLFHSIKNKDVELFRSFINSYDRVHFTLVKGNHDIIHHDILEELVDTVYDQGICKGPFFLSHEPQEHSERYNLCGHIHPTVRLKGKGLQSVRLPCFHFSHKQGVLPAFGSFTGGYTLEQKPEHDIFVIAENEIISLRI